MSLWSIHLPGRGFTYLLTLVDIRCSAFTKGLWAPGLRSHQFVSHIRGVGPAEQNQDAVTRVRGNGCWAGIKQMPQEQCRHKHLLCVCKDLSQKGKRIPLRISNGQSQWLIWDFLGGTESTCQYRRHGFAPWIRKISWRRKWQPTPASLPGKSMDRGTLWATYSPWSHRVRHD